jgi:hypothetical protein
MSSNTTSGWAPEERHAIALDTTGRLELEACLVGGSWAFWWLWDGEPVSLDVQGLAGSYEVS